MFLSAIVPVPVPTILLTPAGICAPSIPFPLPSIVDKADAAAVVGARGQAPVFDVSCQTVNPQSCGSAFSSRFLSCSSAAEAEADVLPTFCGTDDIVAAAIEAVVAIRDDDADIICVADPSVVASDNLAFFSFGSADSNGSESLLEVGEDGDGGGGDGDSLPVDVRARAFVFPFPALPLPLPLATAFASGLEGVVQVFMYVRPRGGEGCKLPDEVRFIPCCICAGTGTRSVVVGIDVAGAVNNRLAGLFPGVVKEVPVPRTEEYC